MKEYYLDEVSQVISGVTSMSSSDREKLLRWFSRKNELIRLDIIKIQLKNYHRIKASFVNMDVSLISLCALFLAVKEVVTVLGSNDKKNRSGNFSFQKKVSATRIKQHLKPKKKPKHEKLLSYSGVIRELTAKEYSSRKISSYLMSVHRFKISHTWVQKFIHEQRYMEVPKKGDE